MILNTKNNFNVLIPLLFVFPFFKESISTFFFILLAINTFYYCYKSKSFIFNKSVILYSIPFWIIFITCLLWFPDNHDFMPIKNCLYFLLFPLVFLNIPNFFFSKEKLNLYFNIFKYVSLIICISYFVAFFYFYDLNNLFQSRYNVPKFRDFIYYEIPFFKIHPTYFTSILIFVTAKAAIDIIHARNWINLIYISVFLLTSFMLLAKVNIIFIFFMLTFIILFRSKISKKNRAFVFILLTACVFLFVNYIPGVKNRFVEIAQSYNKPPDGLSFDSTNIRVAIFNCSKQIAKENILKGVSFSNTKDFLLECYKSNYNSNFYENNSYLTHNYFMYILISSGIFGLLFFMIYTFKIIKTAIKINSFLLYITLINIFLICFTEDFFYRQYGVFYFSLIFYSFLNYCDFKSI